MTRNKWLTIGGLAIIIVAATAFGFHRRTTGLGTADDAVELIDPARVVVLRTPGGVLQVAHLERWEAVEWKTSWTCPLIDCSRLPQTVSRVEVTARYTYTIALAKDWKLQPRDGAYLLKVPLPQLQIPVAFETSTMRIETKERGLFSPDAAANRELVVKHLSPTLAQRGAAPAYLRLVSASADATVREFARKWLLEQNGTTLNRELVVEFGD
jgi:hypothetical protein